MFSLLAQLSGNSVPTNGVQQFNDTVPINPANAGFHITNLSTLLNGVLGVFLAISGFLTFCYLIWGGFVWLTGGSDKSRVEQGRAIITQAIIGITLIAMLLVGFGILTDFLGLRSKVNIGGTGGQSTGGTGGGGGGTSTCTTGTIGQTYNDGGSGGYCSGGGAAMVKCVAAGVGPSGLSYPHFEPCSCVSGTLLPGYSTSGCQ